MEQWEALRVERFSQACYVDSALDGCQHLEQILGSQNAFARGAFEMRADITRTPYACIGAKFDQAVGFSCVGEAVPRLVQVWRGLWSHHQFFSGGKGSVTGHVLHKLGVFQCEVTL